MGGIHRYGMRKSVVHVCSIPSEQQSREFPHLLDSVLKLLPKRSQAFSDQCRTEASKLIELFERGTTAEPFGLHMHQTTSAVSSLDQFLREVDEAGNQRRPMLAGRVYDVLHAHADVVAVDDTVMKSKGELIRAQRHKRHSRRLCREAAAQRAMNKGFPITWNPFELLATEEADIRGTHVHSVYIEQLY